jgi:hypothetical protein
MTDWIPIADAPGDRVVLLYGRVHDVTPEHPQGCIRVTGYWDAVDGVWNLVTPGWDGPTFEPTHWMEIADPPDSGCV